jgi:hypothetical protein
MKVAPLDGALTTSRVPPSLDGAARPELDRIRQQVRDDLADPRTVELARSGRVRFDDEGRAGALRRWPHRLGDLADDFAHVHELEREGVPTGETRYVEQPSTRMESLRTCL